MEENGKTLRSVSSHPMRRVAGFGVSAKQLADKLLSIDKNSSTENPDAQAIRFYALNQLVGLMSARFTENEVLPEWGEKVVSLYCKEMDSQHSRMFWYTFLVISREWRHLKNLDTVSGVKSQPYTPELKALCPTISDSSSEDSLNAWLKKVPDISLKDYCQCLTHSFNTGSFGGGYGGKPWGMIAHTLLNYVNGTISGEVFIDTAYTLAHNNGPMFNKGMMYDKYSSEFMVILDVQRSGQVCEALINKEFANSACTSDIYALALAGKDTLGLGPYVDWHKVVPVITSTSYMKQKAKQDAMHPKPTAPVLVNGKAVKTKSVLEWYPGETVAIYERM